MKGKLDMNAVTSYSSGSPTFSDAEISSLLEQETKILITVVKRKHEDKEKDTSWGSSL